MPRLARRASTAGCNGGRSGAVRAARAGSVVRCTIRSKNSGAAAIASSVSTASGAGSSVTGAASREGVSAGVASVRLEDGVVAEVREEARRARAEREVAARAADHRDQHVLDLRRIDRQAEASEAVEVGQPDAVEPGVAPEVGEQVEGADGSGVRGPELRERLDDEVRLVLGAREVAVRELVTVPRVRERLVAVQLLDAGLEVGTGERVLH